MWRLYLDSWTWQTAIPVAFILSFAVVATLRINGKSMLSSMGIGVLILCLSYGLSVAYIYSWQFYQGDIRDFPIWWYLFIVTLSMFGLIAMSDGLTRAEHKSEIILVILGNIGVVLLCGLILFAAIDVILILSIGIWVYMLLRRDTANFGRIISFLILSITLFYTLLHASMALSQAPIGTKIRNLITLHPVIFLAVYVIVTLALELHFLNLLRSAGTSGSSKINPLWLLVCALYNATYMLPLALGYFDKIQLIAFISLSALLGCTWIFGRRIAL